MSREELESYHRGAAAAANVRRDGISAVFGTVVEVAKAPRIDAFIEGAIHFWTADRKVK